MGETLTLAQEMAQKQKKNQDSMLKNQNEFMKKIDLNYKNSIKKNQQETESYMRQNSKISARLMLKTWSFLLLTILLIASLGGGLTWYMGDQILQSYKEIKQQKIILKQIEKKTYGIRFYEDKEGRYIVLPEGYTIKTGWSLNNKRNELIKLVQE